MKIEKFEDIQAWQEARKLAKEIHEILDRRIDIRLKSQISSAAVSVMSNIAEGFARRSNKEFMQFLFIAKGSLAELQSQIYVLLDLNYLNKDEFDKIYQQTDYVAKLISKFITYLRNNSTQ